VRDESAYRTSRRFEIQTTASHSNNWHKEAIHSTQHFCEWAVYMDEDLPLGVDQVLFPLVNGAIYLKCVKPNKVIAQPSRNVQIFHKCHNQLQN